jgi:hypothetical protein
MLAEAIPLGFELEITKKVASTLHFSNFSTGNGQA